MARNYLAPCGTGVPVERLFSLGPALLSCNRLKMSPQTIRECISLKCWLRFKDKNENLEFGSAVSEKIFGLN